MKALLAFLLFATAIPASGQKPVRGNGNTTTQVRPLERFSGVNIDFVAEVLVTVGESPGIEIVTDDNILPHIGTRIRGGKLLVSQDRWIQPSATPVIRITTPMLARVETSGYSDVEVTGVSGPRFAVDAGVGKVRVLGESDRIRLVTKTGTIDASQLTAETAEIQITSSGTVFVSAAELETDLSERAKVVYAGEPVIRGDLARVINVDAYEPAETTAPERISFVLRNSRLRIAKLEVEGPPEARFGYGFSMGPKAKRDETWPIGTRVYQISLLGGRKLLLTVSARDRGNTIDLFNN
jgi:hypothetical protein